MRVLLLAPLALALGLMAPAAAAGPLDDLPDGPEPPCNPSCIEGEDLALCPEEGSEPTRPTCEGVEPILNIVIGPDPQPCRPSC